MISHQLNFWDLIRYIWQHHIHWIWHHSPESVSSHPLFQRYNTLCIYDIKPTICIISYTMYKAPRPHFMTSHHIIYDITCSVFMTSLPLYLKCYPPFLCHHNDSTDVLRPTVCMTSHRPYVCHLMHSTQCLIHSLWFHTILVITLHPLHSGHHTPYIWYHTHGNTNVISAIWPTISNTTSTLSVSSNPGYHLNHTHSLDDITHSIRVTSYSVCMLSQQLFMTLYPSMYNITPSIFMTSYPIYTLSPYCFHDNTMTVPDISPSIFDTTATVSVSSHKWHTHLYRCSSVSMTSQQVCKSSHFAHVWHHTQSKSHHTHTLWHQWSGYMASQTLHSWHQISSIWHHIHSLGHHNILCMTSTPLYLTSCPLYVCNHTHPIEDITATIWMVSHPVYLWHHIPCI